MPDTLLLPTRGGVRRGVMAAGAVTTTTIVLAALLSLGSAAWAAEATVDLGTAQTYSVLAGNTATNTGPSVLSGDLGVHPGTAAPGFDEATIGGATHLADAEALQAKVDLGIAYDDAASRSLTLPPVLPELGGQTLTSGVYGAATALQLTGTLTLDGEGDENAVFIFQAGSGLTTAPGSEVILVDGARACNVFWQIGSSATLDTGTTFVGTIMALTSVTVANGSTIEGRALARDGAVTLDNDVFTDATCEAASTTTSTTTSSTTSTTSTTSTSSSSTAPTGTATSTATSTAVSTAGGPNTSRGSTPSSSSRLAETGVNPVLVTITVLALALLVLGSLLAMTGRSRVRARVRRH